MYLCMCVCRLTLDIRPAHVCMHASVCIVANFLNLVNSNFFATCVGYDNVCAIHLNSFSYDIYRLNISSCSCILQELSWLIVHG